MAKPRAKPKKRSKLPRIGFSEQKDFFIENLSMLLGSGMDILSALEAIKTEIKSRQMRRVIEDLKVEIDSGSPLWQALKDANLLSAHGLSLVLMGEETGRLPESLKVIVRGQRKDRSFRSKIRSAMIYPVLVLSLTLIVGIGIAWFVLPRLSSVFKQLDLELPVVTKLLMSLGDFLGKYGFIVAPAFLVVIFLLIYFFFFNSHTRFIGQGILWRVPGVKRLLQETELARLGFVLGSLLDAGLPVVDALGSLREAATLPAYKKLYKHLQNSVEEGNSFQKSFKTYPKSNKLVPGPVQQMIVAAEQSGRLPETLLKIGEIFEEKTETTAKNLTVILEPILLIIVWVGVMLVALSVILPIYSLIGGIGK